VFGDRFVYGSGVSGWMVGSEQEEQELATPPFRCLSFSRDNLQIDRQICPVK
jgi:hypothetical protein